MTRTWRTGTRTGAVTLPVALAYHVRVMCVSWLIHMCDTRITCGTRTQVCVTLA